jgi:hypothetical protein
MSTDPRSYDEIAKGTRVRTLVARRARRITGRPSSGYVEIPAGTEGVVNSCTHAGFRGRIHWIRTTGGFYAGEYSANEVEIIASPSNPRWSSSTPERCRR